VARLDRLGWADGFAIRAYGIDIGVRASDASILDSLVERLPYGWAPRERAGVDYLYSVMVGSGKRAEQADARGRRFRPRRYHMLYGDAEQLIRTLEDDDLLEMFERDMRRLVAEFSRTRVFIHAGAVGWRGRAIVLPGRSFSGKTSLVAALVRAGATYYSDEFAVLDARGRLHPFLKPLSIREPGEERQTDYDVEEIGGRAGTRPLPVGCVVFAQYGDGAKWRPRELTPGRAALDLFANAVAARHNPEQILATLRAALVPAVAIKSRRGEADEAAEAILERCDRSSA
jgi:hypothetical protein